jgi:hypothetical protein
MRSATPCSPLNEFPNNTLTQTLHHSEEANQ